MRKNYKDYNHKEHKRIKRTATIEKSTPKRSVPIAKRRVGVIVDTLFNTGFIL